MSLYKNPFICADSMFNLGEYYHTIEKDYDQMKKYYLMAIEEGCVNSMFNLGVYYYEKEPNEEQMKKYFLMAIEKGCIDSMNNMGYYYQYVLNDYEQAIKYYIMAIDTGDDLYNFNQVVKEEDLVKYKKYLDIRNTRKIETF